MPSYRMGVAAAGAAVAILVLVTGIASGALRGHSKTGTVEGTASVVARCPQGGEAISGGFEAPNFGTGAVFGGTSTRVGDNGPAWRVAGWNFDPNEPGALTTYAYCSRHRLNLATRAEFREVLPGEQR